MCAAFSRNNYHAACVQQQTGSWYEWLEDSWGKKTAATDERTQSMRRKKSLFASNDKFSFCWKFGCVAAVTCMETHRISQFTRTHTSCTQNCIPHCSSRINAFLIKTVAKINTALPNTRHFTILQLTKMKKKKKIKKWNALKVATIENVIIELWRLNRTRQPKKK